MYRNSTTEILYDEIDFEIQKLCQELNAIDGIETVESCAGHGKYPCTIWLKCETIHDFNHLLFNYFNHEHGWVIKADVGDPDERCTDLHFVLQSGEYVDEYVVSLMIDNLTRRLMNRD